MLPDAATLSEVKGWLTRADSDLRTAAVARAAEPSLLDAVVFHAQQAAEKALKAFLVLHARSFRKTHSIEEIGEAALAIARRTFDAIVGRVPVTAHP